jgi:hypothetical protein
MVGGKTSGRSQAGPFDTHGFVGALLCGIAYGMSVVLVGFIMGRKRRVDHKLVRRHSLDGTLARFRNIERPRYGFFIDNTTDLLSQLCIFGARRIAIHAVRCPCLGLRVLYDILL